MGVRIDPQDDGGVLVEFLRADTTQAEADAEAVTDNLASAPSRTRTGHGTIGGAAVTSSNPVADAPSDAAERHSYRTPRGAWRRAARESVPGGS